MVRSGLRAHWRSGSVLDPAIRRARGSSLVKEVVALPLVVDAVKTLKSVAREG